MEKQLLLNFSSIEVGGGNDLAKGEKKRNGSNKHKETEADSNILKIAEIEKRQKADQTIGERVAEYVAAFCGSMAFVYLHVAWFGT